MFYNNFVGVIPLLCLNVIPSCLAVSSKIKMFLKSVYNNIAGKPQFFNSLYLIV